MTEPHIAQEANGNLPGNPKLVSSKNELLKLAEYEKEQYAYSVEDYFREPEQDLFKLSPDGLYLSYKGKDSNNQSHIYIKNMETNEVKSILDEGEDLIRNYEWANNNTLVYLKDKNGDENYQLFSIQLDGTNQKDLTPLKGIKVSILSRLKDHKDYMIIEMNKNDPEVFEPYMINITTGQMEKIFDNRDLKEPINDFDFDKNGRVKAYTKQQDGTDYVLYYRTSEYEPFSEVIKTTWKDNFYIIGFNYATDNPDDAYVVSNMFSNTDEILLYDLKKKEIVEKVYSNKTFDAYGIGTSRNRGYELDFCAYLGEKSVLVPVSKTFKKLHNKIKAKFSDKEFDIISETDDESKLLILATSDKLYGTYYLYDIANDTFKEVFNLMPDLNPDDMAEMKSIKFKSRDGLTIYGYLTLPKQAQNQKVPLIVNPHGGPYGQRDYWGFNPEAQLFASRGYATLQLNYRGSGGYGKSFLLAGNKQIGRKMLNDLEDGVAYVKSLNIIDEEKIAIYGASYGGLAALGSLVKTPNLYCCAVDYVGVSNLFTFFKSFPPYWKKYLGQVYEQWYDENSLEDQEIMKTVSPALNIDKIEKPIFVIQGANDPRVNINESDQIVERLRNKGIDVPYMVKYDEGHGFYREENKIELYKAMMGFFAKYFKK